MARVPGIDWEKPKVAPAGFAYPGWDSPDRAEFCFTAVLPDGEAVMGLMDKVGSLLGNAGLRSTLTKRDLRAQLSARQGPAGK